MKQPVKNSGTKAPGAKASTSKAKKKTRAELNSEVWERKRQKKHSGRAASSRANPAVEAAKQSGQGKKSDPRIGSKKPIALTVSDEQSQSTKPQNMHKSAKPKAETVAETRLTPEQELALLENDDRLDALLERLDNGETLSKDDQKWVDSTLDRINALMDELGIEMDDDEEDAQQEDMMQLLKRNNPKDVF
ncbi:MAG: Der GTPase-activating protein YihI [Symbiopectobacterium sp.]|uniref:Der GTPase-activating protein YihI n=1 Tax=Symbiopectobacterium sp. TaxID=2952789 RepID=UPI0039ECF12C